MAIRFQYNKTSLQQQEKALKMRVRTLPTIKAKESALRQQVKHTKMEVERLEARLEEELRGYQGMVRLWGEFDPSLITVQSVELSMKKIAGVMLPVLGDIHYEIRPFSSLLKNIAALEVMPQQVVRHASAMMTASRRLPAEPKKIPTAPERICPPFSE